MMKNIHFSTGVDLSSDYILITPIRNERDNIDQLIDTVMGQTQRPKYWILSVDSNSTDGSYDYLVERLHSQNWVKVVKSLNVASEGYSHMNFARTVNAALEFVFNFCEDVAYVGKTDAEVRLDPKYFEYLVREMDKDDNLAITCGVQRFAIEGKDYVISEGKSDPLVGFNDIRLYRRNFILNIKGYPISYQPDTVLLIKALNMHLKTFVFPQVSFVKRRQGATKIGLWNGHVLRGKGLFILGYRPIYALLYSAYYSRFPPHYQLVPLMFGYTQALINKVERIKDKEVLDYFSKRNLIKTINSIILRDG
jgi:biofilm PGA synthesis N-glycosyltransferase PgaC